MKKSVTFIIIVLFFFLKLDAGKICDLTEQCQRIVQENDFKDIGNDLQDPLIRQAVIDRLQLQNVEKPADELAKFKFYIKKTNGHKINLVQWTDSQMVDFITATQKHTDLLEFFKSLKEVAKSFGNDDEL